FYPVAVVMEMEKLALFTENRSQITRGDLDLMVSRTREEALFELTDYLGKKDQQNTLIILNNLIQDGVHSLAILATLRNYLRKMMIFRSLQNTSPPEWSKQMNAHEFQNNYLPALKETTVYSKMLKGHPYALYMSFKKAADFSIESLKKSLTILLEAEYRLKGAPLPPRIILEELMISLISMTK
ncbi:MAG: DNA polymerase III subunit delta, partial [Deltaproteobacteria bacterium]|nr:DNA polymerase III subunit delta [Deltaproteobacteria bacterium]